MSTPEEINKWVKYGKQALAQRQLATMPRPRFFQVSEIDNLWIGCFTDAAFDSHRTSRTASDAKALALSALQRSGIVWVLNCSSNNVPFLLADRGIKADFVPFSSYMTGNDARAFQRTISDVATQLTQRRQHAHGPTRAGLLVCCDETNLCRSSAFAIALLMHLHTQRLEPTFKQVHIPFPFTNPTSLSNLLIATERHIRELQSQQQKQQQQHQQQQQRGGGDGPRRERPPINSWMDMHSYEVARNNFFLGKAAIRHLFNLFDGTYRFYIGDNRSVCIWPPNVSQAEQDYHNASIVRGLGRDSIVGIIRCCEPHEEKLSGMRYLHIHGLSEHGSAEDHAIIRRAMPQVDAFFADLKKRHSDTRVLFSCIDGANRSAAVMLAFMMYKSKDGFEKLFKLVQRVGQHYFCRPSEGYCDFLWQYQDECASGEAQRAPPPPPPPHSQSQHQQQAGGGAAAQAQQQNPQHVSQHVQERPPAASPMPATRPPLEQWIERASADRARHTVELGKRMLVANNIYIGDDASACVNVAPKNVDSMREEFVRGNFGGVIRCSAAPEAGFPSVDYLFVHMTSQHSAADAQVLKTHLPAIVNFAKRAINNNQNIFVHCADGKTRSPAVIVAILMNINRWTFKRAFQRLQSVRGNVRPADCYCDVLWEYQRELEEMLHLANLPPLQDEEAIPEEVLRAQQEAQQPAVTDLNPQRTSSNSGVGDPTPSQQQPQQQPSHRLPAGDGAAAATAAQAQQQQNQSRPSHADEEEVFPPPPEIDGLIDEWTDAARREAARANTAAGREPFWHRIFHNVWLGNDASSAITNDAGIQREVLLNVRVYNIKGIVRCSASRAIGLRGPETHFVAMSSAGNADDRASFLQGVPAANEFISRIHDGGGAVLIHCQDGYNRGAALLIACIMTRQKWTFERSFKFVQSHRGLVRPNNGYCEALFALETQLQIKLQNANRMPLDDGSQTLSGELQQAESSGGDGGGGADGAGGGASSAESPGAVAESAAGQQQPPPVGGADRTGGIAGGMGTRVSTTIPQPVQQPPARAGGVFVNVDRGLFLADQRGVNYAGGLNLSDNRINCVVSCAIECEPPTSSSILNLHAKVGPGVNQDNSNALLDELRNTIFMIVEQNLDANLNVVVFCDDGAHRAASVMIALLMRFRNMSYAAAHAHLTAACRGIVNINPGFVDMLLQLEAEQQQQQQQQQPTPAIGGGAGEAVTLNNNNNTSNNNGGGVGLGTATNAGDGAAATPAAAAPSNPTVVVNKRNASPLDNWIDMQAYAQVFEDMAIGRFPHRHLIMDKIWLGDQREAGIFPNFEDDRQGKISDAFRRLIGDGIGGIVCCTGEGRAEFRDRRELEYMFVSIGDRATPENEAVLSEKIPQVLEFVMRIQSRGKAVYFHCNAGASRSATVCIATLMAINRWSFERAFKHVYARRGIVKPEFYDWLFRYQVALDIPDEPIAPGAGGAASGGAAALAVQINNPGGGAVDDGGDMDLGEMQVQASNGGDYYGNNDGATGGTAGSLRAGAAGGGASATGTGQQPASPPMERPQIERWMDMDAYRRAVREVGAENFPHFHIIEPNLILGDKKSVGYVIWEDFDDPVQVKNDALANLLSLGVGAIVCLTPEGLTNFPDQFALFTLQIPDHPTPEVTERFLSWLPEMVQFVTRVHQRNKSVIFHCNAGVSRSATAMIALLMHEKCWSFEKAFKHVFAIRPIIRPLFFDVLQRWERQLVSQGKQLEAWQPSAQHTQSTLLPPAAERTQ